MTTRQLGEVGFAVLGAVLVGVGLEGLIAWLVPSLQHLPGWDWRSLDSKAIPSLLLGGILLFFSRSLAGRAFREDPTQSAPEPGSMGEGDALPDGVPIPGLLLAGLSLVGILWILQGGVTASYWALGLMLDSKMEGMESFRDYQLGASLAQLVWGGALLLIAPAIVRRAVSCMAPSGDGPGREGQP